MVQLRHLVISIPTAEGLGEPLTGAGTPSGTGGDGTPALPVGVEGSGDRSPRIGRTRRQMVLGKKVAHGPGSVVSL